jgi:16S rRNA processing protein RimM
MGKVTSVYGVKGWVKVFSYTQPKENLCKYKVWGLDQNGAKRSINVLQCKAHGNGLVAQFENCNDREVAKGYCDSLVRISVSDLPDLTGEDFYWHQLEGLKVITVQDQLLGKVHHMMETGSNDVLVVKKCAGSIDGRERLIPYLLEQVVKNVDLEAGLIQVDWDTEF